MTEYYVVYLLLVFFYILHENKPVTSINIGVLDTPVTSINIGVLDTKDNTTVDTMKQLSKDVNRK